MIPEYTRNKDGLYGPVEKSETKPYYYSKPDHRTNAKPNKNKTRWNIKEGQEFHIFKIAEESENKGEKNNSRWYCDKNKCLFSIYENGRSILGTGGERLAKFPQIVNPKDPWHGYPVTSKEVQNRPSDDLLDLWEKESVIDATTKRRIESKRL